MDRAVSHDLLIVEDEPDLAATLEYNLSREGYRVRCVATGAAAIVALDRDPVPHLVLLDLHLPDISGIEICRRIRQRERTRAVPVIMVTARGEEIDRVVGFEVGADDYVVKPFSVRELLLRVRAVLRRSAGATIAEASKPAEAFGALTIDVAAHRAFVRDAEIHLTALEFKLLHLLYARRGRVQSREQLLSDVWGITADIATRTVDTHMKRLRHKLGAAAAYIETLRGVGYRFRDRPDEAGG